MKKTLRVIGIILILILVILAGKQYMCKKNKAKVLGDNAGKPAQDVLNATKPCEFFSI